MSVYADDDSKFSKKSKTILELLIKLTKNRPSLQDETLFSERGKTLSLQTLEEMNRLILTDADLFLNMGNIVESDFLERKIITKRTGDEALSFLFAAKVFSVYLEQKIPLCVENFEFAIKADTLCAKFLDKEIILV